MIYINHEKQTIFIHIPKTGGSYIGPTLVAHYGFTSYLELIARRRPDHEIVCYTNRMPTIKTGNSTYDNSHFNKVLGLYTYCKTSPFLSEAMNMTSEKWDSYTKFCFTRDPYSRALSGWKHFNKVFNLNMKFADYITSGALYKSDIEYGHIFMTQTAQLYDTDGLCPPNTIIGRFENLEEDFRAILRQIGFTEILHRPFKANVSNTANTNPREALTLPRHTIHKLNEIFKDDFINFHYVWRV